jgi:hypothetical protein
MQSVLPTECVDRRHHDLSGIDETARRTPAALDLHNGRGRRRDDVGQLGREFSQHAVILAEGCEVHITRTGGSPS